MHTRMDFMMEEHDMQDFVEDLKKNRFLLLLLLPGMLVIFIFTYIPMGGLVIAFQEYNPVAGLRGSDFVGLAHFRDFFMSPDAFKLIKNTFLLNMYQLIWGFAAPIVFAIALNELRNKYLKSAIQTISYLPHFISTVIVVGIINILLSLDTGIINQALNGVFGIEKIYFLSEPQYFRTIYVASGIWQTLGWTSIIYLATIVSIDPQQYEAATIDGASRMQRIVHITLPGLQSTILIMLILSFGGLMADGFEKVYLLSTPVTYDVSDVIATYVYRRGLGVGSGWPEYSFAAAVGMFQSTVNASLLIIVNGLCRKYFDRGIY